MEIRLFVDKEEIPMNDFVSRIMSGMTVGAVTSLRGIGNEWKEIKIEIMRSL